MGARQREWARKSRESIFDVLGRVCVGCGTTENLTLDVIVAPENGDKHHRMEWSWRTSFYRKELAAGNLQVMCDVCNTRKGGKTSPLTQSEPF
jgi:hypothetical protein